jgi:predicted phage terminase large subunit-like protein
MAAVSWQELKDVYVEAARIPDNVFYDFINHAKFREDARNKMELGLDKYLEEMLQYEVFREGRRRARQDLYFLTRYFCWETNAECSGKTFAENMICEHVHRRLCDLFVRKDNNKGIADQDTFKERLILYPRGTQKSTIDVVDAAQWIINIPEIRILFLTAVDDRAVSFVNELKGHFVEKLYEPSLMNIFFPEFCAPESEIGKESAFQFTSPMWKRQNLRRREPTVIASSITSDLAGMHFDVVKGDDIVSNRNSENEDMCKRITARINISVRKMLMSYGYFDIVGTRYADEDYYGDLLAKNVGTLEKQSGPCWDITENAQMKWKTLIGRAIVIKPEVAAQLEKEKRPITYKEAGEEGCYLLFPEVLSYAYLMKDFALDEISFEGQRNNNARPVSLTPFTRPMLLKATVHFEKMPFRGPTSQTWDFAFSQKKGRDYSTGCCALWDDKGTAYINDLIRDRFQPNDLAQAVVDFARRWHPFIIGIEDAGGSRAFESAIQMAAQRTGDQQVIAVCNAIDWVTPTNNKDAKRTRMGSLHPWIVNDQLKFSAHLPHLEALYSEFERCMSSHHHDDIPDVISRQTKYGPRMLQVIEKNDISTWTKSNAAYNLLFEENCDAFGRIGMGWVPTINPEPEVDNSPKIETPSTAFDPILGAGIYG